MSIPVKISPHGARQGRLEAFKRSIPVLAMLLAFWPVAAGANIIRDAEIEAGFEELIEPIAEAAGFSKDDIRVRILLNNEYNAFVIDGETVYVTSRLVEDAWDVSEFLGVMAHEIAHIREGHVARNSEVQQEASQAAALATFAAIAAAAGGHTDAATGILLGGTGNATRYHLSHTRQAESIADETALELLEAAGLSASGLRDLMKRFAGQSALPENRQSPYYLTHPDARERLLHVQDHLRTSHVGDELAPVVLQEDYSRLRAKLMAWTSPPTRQFLPEEDTIRLASVKDYALAITEYRDGMLLSALDRLEMLVDEFPTDAYFHEFRGDVLFALARPDEAVEAYLTALELAPETPHIQLSLGRALIAAGGASQVEQAVGVLASARLSEPYWAFVHRQYAVALGRSGRIAEADLALAEEAILLGDQDRAVGLARRALDDKELDPSLRSRIEDLIYRYGE